MSLEITTEQEVFQVSVREFVRREIAPHADRWDREELMPREVVAKLAEQGYLGSLIPPELGGTFNDMITFCLLNEELGRGCSSVRSLLTVHGMVQYAILRWGSDLLKKRWLPRLASGKTIGAFGLTEPATGSDARAIQTSARPNGASYVLDGTKVWNTFGQIADLFLIFAQQDGKIGAFLVERDRRGFTTTPMSGALGTRASMLATLWLETCEVPRENLVGGMGFGLSAVGTTALDIGRYSVACGAVGIAQACLDASIAYASQRKQYGALLKDHQLIRKMITEMVVNISAARCLCLRAGHLKDAGDPRTVLETLVAKYCASKAAVQAAGDAVQIHGANGFGGDYPVQRYLRDSKVTEIIEGSSQILEIMIAKEVYDTYGSVA
jgi:alkylation response protein AidB-like acyl-CoA dehydrogenase